MYDYDAQEADKLRFKAGDRIFVFEIDESGWWIGESISSGKKGLFPGEYVKWEDTVPVAPLSKIAKGQSFLHFGAV